MFNSVEARNNTRFNKLSLFLVSISTIIFDYFLNFVGTLHFFRCLFSSPFYVRKFGFGLGQIFLSGNFTTIQPLDSVTASIRFELGIVILIDYILIVFEELVSVLIPRLFKVFRRCFSLNHWVKDFNWKNIRKNFRKTFTFVNFEYFYFGMLYEEFKILKLSDGIFYTVKFIIEKFWVGNPKSSMMKY